MCSLAPRAAAPGFGTTAFLDRQRGVVAAVAAPAATSVHNAGEPTRRARASEASAAPARKRGRHDAFEHAVVDPAASSALRVRMDAELVALQGLLKRAKLLPRRSTPPAEKEEYGPTPSDAPAVSSAAKRRASPSKPATEAAYAPAKQQRPVMQMQSAEAKNTNAPEVPNNKQRPAEAPAAKQQQQRPVQRAAAAKTEVPKKQRPEEEKELARAAAREEFRQMLLEMERSALPDETVYPEELEALGIPFEFVVTRTWKQALLEDRRMAARHGVGATVAVV